GNAGSAAAPFRTVQRAINAAAATADGPDVVQVEAGTYDAAGVDLGLNIPASANLQNLQLLGGYDAGQGFTTRTPRTTVYIPQTPGSPNLQDVNVANPNVTIDGFHFVFDGNGVGGTGGTRQSGGILSNATGFVFNNNTIEVGLGRTAATGARSLGIATTSTNQTGLQITNNTITADAGTPGAFNDASHGIFLNPDAARTTDAIITGNTITGSTLANGVIIDPTGHVSITGNTFARTPSAAASSPFAMIALRSRTATTALSNVTISGNTINGGNRPGSSGVQLDDNAGTQPIANVLVEQNLIQHNNFGVVIGPGTSNQQSQITATV